MNKEVIRVEGLSKLYRLGQIGTGTISKDLNRWWARIKGNEDPYARMGQLNDRTQKSQGNDLVWALKDINFSVSQGEVVGVIGRNGAGKSTLLKIISQITTPTRGSIKIKGRVASLLEVGTGFHPEMTGRENVFMNGTLLGMTRLEIQSKLESIVDFAGVALYIDTPVKRYSSGMQVRLAFAVAAFLEPEILIVDEVLAVGDADFQKQAIGKMQDVSRQEGRTVLFVSHNMAAIKSLCSNSIVLHNGSVMGRWESETAIKNYLRNTFIVDDNMSKILSDVLNKDLDPVIKYTGFNLLQDGILTTEIHNDALIEIRLQFEIKQDIYGFRLFADLIDDNGFNISRTFFDEENDMGSFIQSGIYESGLIIPPDLLIEGNYYVTFFAGIHGVRMLNPREGLNIHINVLETGYIKRKRFRSEFKGAVTLPFVWQTRKITERIANDL